jgi:hypothetical protein
MRRSPTHPSPDGSPWILYRRGFYIAEYLDDPLVGALAALLIFRDAVAGGSDRAHVLCAKQLRGVAQCHLDGWSYNPGGVAGGSDRAHVLPQSDFGGWRNATSMGGPMMPAAWWQEVSGRAHVLCAKQLRGVAQCHLDGWSYDAGGVVAGGSDRAHVLPQGDFGGWRKAASTGGPMMPAAWWREVSGRAHVLPQCHLDGGS